MPGDAQRREACSLACLLLLEHMMKNMDAPDPSKHERAAAAGAMGAVGEAIEATGLTDLALMSVEQFQSVVLTAFTATAFELRKLVDDNAVPF